MRKLKISNYIIINENENNMLLFNPYNGAMLDIEQSRMAEYKEILYSDNIYYDEINEIIKELYDGQFLIEESLNEKNRIYELYNEICKNESIFHLTIMPTEKCNFRCIYCYENYKKGEMSAINQEKLIKFVTKKLENVKAFYVSWFGGEPLLASNVVINLSNKFIELCKQRKIPYLANMTTNGYFLDLNTFNQMNKLRITSYQITLDGNKKTHDVQRPLINGAPTFDTILKNLIDIKENSKSQLVNFNIRVNLTNDIDETSMIEFCEILSKKLNDKRFNIIIRCAWNGKKKEEFSSKQIESKKIMNSVPVNILLQNIGKINFDSEFGMLCAGGYVCYAGKSNSYVVGSDLKIYKCTVHFDDEINKIGYIDNKGNLVVDQKKLKVWESSRLYDEKTPCFNCKNVLSCLGVGCTYNNIILNDKSMVTESCESIGEMINYFIEINRKKAKKVE